MLGKFAKNPNFRLPLKPGTALGSSQLVEGPAATLAGPFLFLRTGAAVIWLDSGFMMVVRVCKTFIMIMQVVTSRPLFSRVM